MWWLTAEASGLGISFVDALYLLALSSMVVLIPAGPGLRGDDGRGGRRSARARWT